MGKTTYRGTIRFPDTDVRGEGRRVELTLEPVIEEREPGDVGLHGLLPYQRDTVKAEDVLLASMQGVGAYVTRQREVIMIRPAAGFRELFVGPRAELKCVEPFPGAGGTVGQANRARLHLMLDEWIDQHL